MGRPKSKTKMQQYTMRINQALYHRAIAAAASLTSRTGNVVNIQHLTESALVEKLDKLEKKK